MSEPYIGQIQPFGFNYAPQNWAQCNGQQMSISQNSALFALLGVMYGGNGTTVFNLPDLRGRMMMHVSPQNPQGQMAGSATVTLTPNQMPAHSHALEAFNVNATTDTPSSSVGLAKPNGETVGTQEGVAVRIYAPVQGATVVPLAPQTVGVTGGSQPINILPPYTVVNVCIALFGLFPPRD